VEDPVCRDDADLVVRVDVAQFAKERIAMPREPDVAIVARQRRSRNVADCKTQRTRVTSCTNYGGYAKSRDLDPADGRTDGDRPMRKNGSRRCGR
jgi:hypothetical protein